MRRFVLMVAVAAVAAVATAARADEAERLPSVVVTSEDDARAVISRLAGHEVRRTGDRVYLLDVEDGARPWIGVVERRGRALWLVGDDFALELRGPLARPRLAGPGYTVWIAGRVTGPRIQVRRLGVLRPPA